MIEEERIQHELHARTPGHKRKLDATRTIISDMLEQCKAPYIAYSTGIDSLVMLDLIWQQSPGLPILWGDDGCDYPETIEFLKETEDRYGRIYHVRSLDPWASWCKEMGRDDLACDPAAYEVWINPKHWDYQWPSLTKGAQNLYDGVFLGLLASESQSRRLALNGGRKATYTVQSEGGMIHCSPLAAWTKGDVWAYVASNNLPYNSVYDRLAQFGISLEKRRVAPLTCFRVMQYGSHAAIRRGWPDMHNRLANLFPKIKSFS